METININRINRGTIGCGSKEQLLQEIEKLMNECLLREEKLKLSIWQNPTSLTYVINWQYVLDK